MCDQDCCPIKLSVGYSTEAGAADARDFAIKTLNSGRPVRIKRWHPIAAANRGSICVPPSGEEAVTVRVMHTMWNGVQTWRLQARHPDGSVLVTSLPLPD